jgi:predicted peptidase
MKRLSLYFMFFSVLAVSCQPDYAPGVKGYLSVGDWGYMVDSIDITVPDRATVKNLKASDFELTGNTYGTPYDPTTGEFAQDYADDEISVTVDRNRVRVRFRPFRAEGRLGQNFRSVPWELKSQKAGITVTDKDITERATDIIDDCITGSFTYAGLTREYMLYLPKDENGNPLKNVPLLVWQIGGGEYNKPLLETIIANRGLVALPQKGIPCAVLEFALANENYSYSASLFPEKIKLIDRNNALQMAFIDTLIEQGLVDGNRLFCAGASSGGGCTMRFMMQFADRFKAAIPCCAMDPIVPIHRVNEKYDGQFTNDVVKAFQGDVYRWNGTEMVASKINLDAFLATPLYFVHAQDDQTCKVISSHVYFDARKRLGAKDDRITIYSDEYMKKFGVGGMLNHFSWVTLLDDYSEGSAMDWLLKQF